VKLGPFIKKAMHILSQCLSALKFDTPSFIAYIQNKCESFLLPLGLFILKKGKPVCKVFPSAVSQPVILLRCQDNALEQAKSEDIGTICGTTSFVQNT